MSRANSGEDRGIGWHIAPCARKSVGISIASQLILAHTGVMATAMSAHENLAADDTACIALVQEKIGSYSHGDVTVVSCEPYFKPDSLGVESLFVVVWLTPPDGETWNVPEVEILRDTVADVVAGSPCPTRVYVDIRMAVDEPCQQ